MREITKSSEPASLAQHRRRQHADYDNYAAKDDLRQSLAREQRGLCCYCLSRIHPAGDQMKIEHWRCQDHFPAEQLDYANLLGACLGNEGQTLNKQHCDTLKANRHLSRNPANPAHQVERLVHFEGDGRITSPDSTFDAELNDALNLNVSFLKNNRRAVLDAFKTTLSKYGQLPRPTLERWLREWNGEAHTGELKPFCQVVVYWLRKRLARA